MKGAEHANQRLLGRSIKFEVSATVEVAPGDDADKVYEKTRAWVHERAKREAETP